MQNQETKAVEKLTKQEYNRLYYRKNKNRWGGKKKDCLYENVVQLFTRVVQVPRPLVIASGGWGFILSVVELIVLLGLVCIFTTFLIKEAAGFYIDAQDNSLTAYIKAGLIETTAILFSLSKSRSLFLKWAQRVMVVMLCAFSLCVMSGKLLKIAVGDTSRVQTMRLNLQQLESELSQKEELRTQFLKAGKLTMARRYEKGLDQIRHRLIVGRQELSNLQSPQIITNEVLILISFRLFLVVANLICVHRIAENFGSVFGSFENKNKLDRLISS